ncbi:alkaline phosphatase D family protein [Thalassomonas sp. RHCl1]|uniref:alkaline phosphatase D family protein n=1 Tax=Thalassomonas sp. RHCl1 TaxID=2995320 RepID=UPI00248C309B|nr:alkaline phosphatase D family protein [Thalassomonas sp. RHCl1]
MRYLTTLTLLAISGISHAAPEVHYDQCKSSFNYKLNTYLGTTDADNSGQQWCYLKSPVDGSSWGIVREETIPLQQTRGGENCNAVTEYQGEKIHGCTSKNHTSPWCYKPSGGWDECKLPAGEPLLAHSQLNTSKRLDTISAGSCFKVKGDMPAAMSRVIAQQPDLFLWLGDNIYADTTDMALMAQKYDDKKQNADYKRFLEADIPVMATWDDHDFGANNDGKHYPKRAQSQQAFLRHYDVPADDPRFNGQQGIYSAKIAGPVNETTHVIMLDARYFRSPTFSSYGQCEGENSTILGQQQWSWLQAELNKKSEIKIIASGIQVLPPLNRERNKSSYCAYGDGKQFDQAISNLQEQDMSGTNYESWAEMPQQREKLLRMAQKSMNDGNAKAIIFVSGDQHWGELLQKNMPASTEHGGEVALYEVTASGFGQNWPYHIPNPLRLPVYADTAGNGNFNNQCKLPFKYGGIEYKGCITLDNTKPWCYTELDSSGKGIEGKWGNCAPTGATIPTGKVGVVSADIAALTTGDRHLVNKSGSNYGKIDIDWQKRAIKMAIETASEEAVSTVINF